MGVSNAPPRLNTAHGAAPSYSARAWVNFNGTGTVVIRSSGNVSSITDNSAGVYTVNFSEPLEASSFVVTGAAVDGSIQHQNPYEVSTGSVKVLVVNRATGAVDSENVNVAIFL